MINKICAECNSINGERATYCRKCNASLDNAVIKEVQVVREQARPSAKPVARPSSRPASRPNPVRHEEVVLPKRPAKPDVIYWPFVVSLVSMFLMLALVFSFVMTYGKEDSAPTVTAAANAGTAASTTAAPEETTETATDLSEITIGDIADQTYTGDFITIPFSLTYNGVDLQEGVDYTITYENNIEVGVADVYFEGTGDTYSGSFSTTFNIVTGDEVCDDPANHDLNIFVMRIYWTMVGRSPSIDELIGYVHRIRDGELTGVECINEITFCDEAVARQLNDFDFVDAFYQGALARPADPDGLEYNVGLLEDGMSREAFVNNILNTEGGEFEAICDSLGIPLS